MKTQYETFKKTLLEHLDARLEHEERETDVYADYFDYAENRRRYAELIQQKDDRFKEFTTETITDALACTCYYEVIPGSIFGPYDFNDEKGITLDSAAIQETEEQFCFDDSYAIERLGVSPYWIKPFFRLAEKEREICATISNDQALCYQVTDAVWFAVISFDSLDELYRDLKDGQ